MNTKTLRQLDILEGGIRLSNTTRKLNGVLRFNNSTKKLQIYTGDLDIDGNEWIDVNRGIATEDKVGSVKVGDNLFINEETAKVNAISVGPSLFYQHIVTVSKYNIPFEQHITTELPDGTIIKGGSGDFTTITEALNFIENLDSSDYPRNSDNRWLIYIAPGVYKENITLLPFVSIKGYGKTVTILEPEDDTNKHITMTTDTALFDLSVNFNNELDVLSKTIIQVNTNLGRETVATDDRNFTNNVLIKDLDFSISSVNSTTLVDLVSGNLNFEDTLVNLSQDNFETGEDSEIYCFNLSGSTNLNILEGKFNFTVNHQEFIFCNSHSSKVSIINTFVDVVENLTQSIDINTNIIIKSLNSEVTVRNSQLKNLSKNGKVFLLVDDSERSIFNIEDSDIISLSITDGIMTLEASSVIAKTNIINKINDKSGVKINNNNYKISHIESDELTFTITLDNDRHSNVTENFKYENVESVDNVSDVNVIYSGGNKYLFNGDTIYESDKKWVMGLGTYKLRNVPLEHPIAFLNSGKEAFITYSGDNLKGSKIVNGVSYKFYYGDVDVTVSGDFGVMSIYCFHHKYMGGQDLILYDNSATIKILNLNSISNSYLRSNSNIIECESNNFIIENNDVSKEQGDYLITGECLVEFNDYNVIHVSKDKKDFNNISNAIKSLGKIEPNLKYLIKVHTGRYIETESIDLSSYDNISIIGDSYVNTEIVFELSGIPEDGYLLNGNSGLIQNLKISYISTSILDEKIDVIKFIGKTVNLNNIDMVIESNNVNAIRLNSCSSVNYLKNTNINLKYYFKTNKGGEDDSVIGLMADSSNLLDIENFNINISASEKSDSDVDNTGKILYNINLVNTKINAQNIDLELTTELNDCYLINSEETISNNFKNQIYGNSLIVNSDKATNYILNNDTSGRFILINSNILGDFNGSNIFTTGCVLLNESDNNVHSYHTSLLSNNKDSILIGNNAGENTMGNSASKNILIGTNSGRNLTTGNENLMIGNETGNSLTSESQNLIMGYQAGSNLVDNQSVMVGYNSGFNSVNKNLFVGTYSGYNITGEKNIVLGSYDKNSDDVTGVTNIDVDNNIFIGNDAGIESSGNSNICLGSGAGIKDEGSYNLNIGNFTSSNNSYDSVELPTETGSNINIGHMAGRKSYNNSKSINIGVASGENSNVNNNINIGYKTGRINDGSNNTLIGNETGSNLIGTNNVVLGNDSLIGEEGMTSITGNVMVGEKAGKNIKSNRNVIIGTEAGELTSDKKISDDNILIGYQAGNSMGIDKTSEDDGPIGNIFLGKLSGTNSQGSSNVFVGTNSGTQNVSGTSNVFIGNNSGSSMTTGGDGVLIGNNSGQSASTITGDILIGNNAGSSITGNKNTLVGFNSGKITGQHNSFLGYEAGENSEGDKNTIIGYASGKLIKSDSNVVVGSSSLTSQIDAGAANDGNVIIGNQSGTKIVGGGNVNVGFKSGEKNEGINNTILGYNAQSFNSAEKATENNTIIGKDAAKNLFGDKNLVIGSSAGEGDISNQVDENLLIGYRAGILNNKFNNLMIVGNNSGTQIRESETSYYDDSENLVIGNNSLTSATSKGNVVVGNSSGTSLTTGENNTLIGDKSGNSLVTGSNNIILGNSKSLIFKKLAANNYDISNTYYSIGSQTWELSNVSNPNVVSGNTLGSIEFCVETFTPDNKVMAVKSLTTYNNYEFSSIAINSIDYLMKIDSTSGYNQLANKNFIRNFGGNNWGRYITNDYQDIVPDSTETIDSIGFTSRQDYDDSFPTSSIYKKNNCPIIYSPGDIVKVNFTTSSVTKEITIKIYAIVQVVKRKDNTDIKFTDNGTSPDPVSLADLVKLQTGSDKNDYHIMDERMYYDLIQDDGLPTSNFRIDNSTDFTITKVTSPGGNNSIGNENMFMGVSSGNTSEGQKNLNIGYKNSTHSTIGNSNTIIGNRAGENINEGENNTIIGENAGKYTCSTGNTIIGRNNAENAIGLSNNIIVGSDSAKVLDKSNNIIVGNRVNLEKDNTIIIGNNCEAKEDGSVLIGNGMENDNKGTLLLGNKVVTKTRNVNYTVHNSHLYIPVNNAMIFGYDELLKINNQNFLNTVADTDYYLPYKSIIHRFPMGKCSIEKEDETSVVYYELRDYSKQLRYINLLDNTNTTIDLTNSSYDLKRPFISIKLIGDSTSGNNGVYEVYTLPQKTTSYDFIKIKKLKSNDQEFEISEMTEQSTSDLENVEIEIDNNILILSQNTASLPYGRLDGNSTETNIFGGGTTITSIAEDMIVEKLNSGTFSEKNTSTNIFTIDNANKIYALGDSVNVACDSNTVTFSTNYTIIQVNSTQVTLNTSVTLPSSINDDSKRLIKVENNKNLITGNTANNKIVINGTESDLESEKATLSVKGSVSLTDFLMLKVSDQANIELSNQEAIIWLEESGGNPSLKIKYKNGSGVNKTGTISLSLS